MTRGSMLVALAMMAAGCLPADNRPPPGSLFVDAVQSDATRDGFTTSDGWQVRFDRFVTSIGDLELDDDEDGAGDDSCNDYSEADYTRLFDFSVATPGKIAVVYGLGSCSAQFEVGSPQSNTVLGDGVSAADLETMRIEDTDAWVENERTALIARGTATRAGETKSFDWVFRRSIDIEDCKTSDGDGAYSVIQLAGEESYERTIEVRGEELFRELPTDGAPLVFDRIAEADADGDGEVTLEELDAVEIPLDDIVDLVLEELDEDELPDVFDVSLLGEQSLGTLVYMILMPRIARFAGGGECRLDFIDRRRFR